jgi:phosphatidylinositol alpha-1,6-mannosyltransferase
LLLVGDGPEMGPIRRLADELGVAGRVVWTGAVPPRDVPAHVAAMDAAVVTARDAASFHYSPLKLREYMMCGKPVVVPAAGEMARALGEGRQALFYRPGNVPDLRRALLGLLDDPARAREIGAAGQRFAAAEGTWDAQLDRLLARLRELSAPPPEHRSRRYADST